MSSEEKIWQVKLTDGTVYVPSDSRPDDPRRSWIYSRHIADLFAKDVGGTVVEVTPRQKEAVLDKEIAFALNEPKPTSKSPESKAPKIRSRPFPRDARRKLRTAILEYVEMNHRTRSAVDTAQETSDDAEYKAALRTLKAGLPETLWIGYDPDEDLEGVSAVAPMWISEDPEGGEDPRHWMQIDRDEIARMLVQDA